MSDRKRDTNELIGGSPMESDPPTAVTNIPNLQAVLRGDIWTMTLLTGDRTGMVLPLSEKPIVVGRGAESTVREPDDSLSRTHARFYVFDGQARVEDLGSTNGTFIEGARVPAGALLPNGARVQLGLRTTIRVQLQNPAEVESAQALFESSIRDPLTGVSNRRYLDDRLEAELAFAVRHRTPLSVVMLDIDHFKKINDTLGHAAGDAVLRAFGSWLLEAVRKEDVVARYGGEEFTLLLREASAAGALVLGERARALTESTPVDYQGTAVRFTVSIGIATHDKMTPFKTGADLVDAADQCLYRAKRAGRNVVVSDSSPRSIPPARNP